MRTGQLKSLFIYLFPAGEKECCFIQLIMAQTVRASDSKTMSVLGSA